MGTLAAVTELDDLLTRAPRCMLALAGRRGPLLMPMAHWWDGEGAWMSTAAATAKVRVLRRDPACQVYVPALDGSGAGAVLHGRARIYGTDDPVGLVLHGPMISAAMAALAVKHAPTVLGYAQDVTRLPPAWLPRNRVALRVVADEIAAVAEPEVGAGIAPALPAAVPADVRRALAGARKVVVAVGTPGRLAEVMPAVWDAGLTLTVAGGRRLAEGSAVTATVAVEPVTRPTALVGLSLTGRITDGALVPARATWWHGFTLQTVPVPPRRAPAIQLPD